MKQRLNFDSIYLQCVGSLNAACIGALFAPWFELLEESVLLNEVPTPGENVPPPVTKYLILKMKRNIKNVYVKTWTNWKKLAFFD